ncbi:MAG: hypothetical protein K9K64_00785 [Desulfohalobiaceae bacterium]|nr:hypothetical protein [Desulfohalobiaceae bacterium]
MEKLMAYPWPGNVRELRNVIEYAFVLAQGRTLAVDDLPQKIIHVPRPEGESGQATERSGSGRGQEPEQLMQALQKAGGNRTRAAAMLGVSRVTVWKRMKKYSIQAEDLVPEINSLKTIEVSYKF